MSYHLSSCGNMNPFFLVICLVMVAYDFQVSFLVQFVVSVSVT